MTVEKKKRFILQIIAAVILAVLITMLVLLPRLLQNESSLIPLKFITTEQGERNNILRHSGSFNRDVVEGETVWLYAENAMIEFSVSGLTYSFNERGDTPAMFRSPGCGWYSFSPPSLKAGESVEIDVYSYYGDNIRASESLLRRIYTGDGAGLFALLLNQINFFGIVLSFAAIAGIIYMVEGIIDIALGMNTGGRIFLFGLYFLTGSLWCVPDVIYPYITLFIAPRWVAGLLDMSGLLLFPIALALMMQYYIRGKRNRLVMRGILLAESILAMFCLVLQFTGKADLIEQQLVIGGVALVSLGIAMVCVVLELRNRKDKYLLFLFLSVLPVFISEILDGINIIWPFMPRRTLMQYSFGLSILLLTFQFVGYANTELAKADKLRKMEQELVDSRISIMLSQIQPHFLYNALTGIKSLCGRDPDKAQDAMEHFSYFLRSNLDSLSDTGLIPFTKEISHVKDYFYLENMRFKDRVNLVLKLEYQDFRLPPMTLQPLVENAVRYGITKKDNGGTITIESCQQNGSILVTIRDDGVGFDMNAPKEDGRSHTGIENVRSRLKLQCGGTLEIKSEIDRGTEVRIILPGKEELI